MRVPVLVIAVLLAGAAAQAEDLPQPPTSQFEPQPAAAGAPVKIIETAPAPAAKGDKGDQSPAVVAPEPLASTRPKITDKAAKAPEAPAEDSGNRFSFVRVDDGFLRFDLKTGQVAYCNSHPDGWACEAVPENRSTLEREVKSLKDEVAALKHQIETLREPPAPRPPAPIPSPGTPPAAQGQGDLTRDVPGHDDIARARAVLQDVWQRLVDAIVGFKNDVMRQS